MGLNSRRTCWYDDDDVITIPYHTLQAISERLAENSHDVWAVSKIKQLEGTGQTHPDLKPYDLMTDAQKEYDRKASTDTLKYV